MSNHKPLSERVAEWLRLDDVRYTHAKAHHGAAQIIREQQTEIESIQKTLTASLGAADFWQEAETFRTTERDRLRAENEALRADAERYRLVRSQEGVSISMTYDGNTGSTTWMQGEELDQWCDAARSQP